MRRMITRLLLAKLIPVAISFVTKAFRKKRAAAKQPKPNHTEALNNNEAPALEDNG